MVLDEELKPLHELTSIGRENYYTLLECIADEILFKHEHPLKWALSRVAEEFRKIASFFGAQ